MRLSIGQRTRAWWMVMVAVLLEIAWAVGLPFTDGFSKPFPTIFVVAAMMLVLIPLALAARHLPIGSLYAVWTGLGAAGTAGVSIVMHGDPFTPIRVLGVAAIVLGVGGLRFFDASGSPDLGPPS